MLVTLRFPLHFAVWAVPLLALSLASTPALAQEAAPSATAEGETEPPRVSRDDEAREAFLVGRDAYENGDFELALAQFQTSYAASGRPEILYNIATALDRLGRFEEALEYFGRYIEALPDADNHEFVRARMGVLRDLIDSRAAQERARAEAERQANEAAEPPSIIPPIAVAGTGAALGIVSLGLLAKGHGDLDDVEATCEAGGCRDVDAVIDDSNVERTRAMVRAFGISGAVLAAAGTTWILLQDRDGDGDDDEDAARVQLRPVVGFGTLHLQGSF